MNNCFKLWIILKIFGNLLFHVEETPAKHEDPYFILMLYYQIYLSQVIILFNFYRDPNCNNSSIFNTCEQNKEDSSHVLICILAIGISILCWVDL